MTVDVALKLRLTQLVTGCVTQKAMHARFKLVNPKTGYEPERAYKWVQDRAAPRDPSVYDDLARVLDLPVTGETVRTCSFAEFRRLVEARHGPAPAVVPRRPPDGTSPAVTDLAGGDPPLPHYLVGRYLTFSMAWSATQVGRLIVGLLTVEKDGAGGLRAVYEENLPAGELILAGPVRHFGRALTALVSNETDGMFIFLSFRPPLAPALALTGMMSGTAYHDADARPIAGRIFCVRIAGGDRAPLLALTGYREAGDGAVADALVAAGMPPGRSAALAPGIVALATGPARDGIVDIGSEMVNVAVGALYDAEG